MNQKLVLFVGKTDVFLRRYISLLRFAADGRVVVIVARGLASFSHARNRSFLLHLTLRFGPLPPAFRPSFSARRRPVFPHPTRFFILYSRALPASSHLPFSHPSLRISSRLACYVSSPPFFSCCFLFILSHSCIFLSFLPYHQEYLRLFYHAIVLALLLPCLSSPILIFFFSPSPPSPLSLVYSNFLC